MPGTDIDDAVQLVFGELPDLPYLPELPERGVGSDMLGRAASVLAELHVDLQPSGWRLLGAGAGAGGDERRAADLLRRDLDALEIGALDYAGHLKLQMTGPWTLAAGVELPRGGAALLDAGATRDVAEALTEGLLGHVAEVQRRVPGARMIVQLDEPSLPAVLAGHIPTPSGFSTVPAVEESTAAERLGGVFDAVAATGAVVGVHCCATRAPLGLLRQAGAGFLSFDGRVDVDLDAVGEAVEAGIFLVVGVVPGAGGRGAGGGGAGSGGGGPETGILSDPARTVEPARRLWRRLGFVPERLGEVVAVSPTCGLAGASPAYARAALSGLRKASRLLVDEPS
ncbi:MAG TPA: methionine synthase [Frankiaceae bacterium]|nr:methionine synthase [Frankiaceae bacterium]